MSGFNHPENDQSEKKKMPEFIYVEKEGGTQEEFRQSYEQRYYQPFETMGKKHYPLIVRVVCFTGALFLLLTCAFALPFLFIFSLINLVTFFKMENFWTRTKMLWNQLSKVLVATMGLTLAVFSPPFGFAVIMVYFLLHGQSMEDDWMGRRMKSQFYRD